MGGLTEAYAMASMQFITFDAEGNCVGSNLHGLPAADRLGDARATSCTRSSRRARTTRSAPRASASAPPSAGRPRSSTRSSTRSRAPASATSTCRCCRTGSTRRSPQRHDVSGAPPVKTDDSMRRASPMRRLGRPGAGRRAGPPRRGVRAGDRGLAAGSVLRPAGLARDRHRDGRALRLDRRRLRRAGRHPRGPAGDRRPRAAAAAARHARAVRRGRPGRHGGRSRSPARAREPCRCTSSRWSRPRTW